MVADAKRVKAIGTASIASLVLHAGVGVLGAVLMARSGDFATNLNHPIQFVSLGSGALVATLFLGWVSLTHAYARCVSSEVRFDRPWAIAGFFVPFVNLVHPYRVVSDLWRALTHADVTPVRVWWFGIMGVLAVVFGASKLVEPADRIYVQVAGGVTSAVLCLATAYIVGRIVRGTGPVNEK
jgi:hypothetical protein